jgi:hypothetical protein
MHERYWAMQDKGLSYLLQQPAQPAYCTLQLLLHM